MSGHKKQPSFDFAQAITQPFQSRDGFVWRVIIPMAALLSVTFIIFFPMIYVEYGQILDINYRNVQDLLAGKELDSSDEILAIFASVWKPYLLMFILLWFATVAGETALHRKNFLNAENPTMPLRFGQAELRTALAVIGVWLVAFLGYFLAVFALGVIVNIGAMISPALGAMFAVLGFVFVLAVWVFISVRFSPASALSVREDKLHILKAANISKDRFWPMFGSYAFLFFFGYIILSAISSLLIMLIFGDNNLGAGEVLPSEQLQAMAEQLQSPFKKIIGVIALVIHMSAISLWCLMISGIGTYAVKLWDETQV